MNSILKSGTNYRWIAIMLAIYSGIQVYCINKLSLNSDEGSFATYGVTILKLEGNKDIKRFESKLPITALNMLPRAVNQLIHPRMKKTWPESITDIIYGRYISLVVSILLGLLIFKWTSELYSEKEGLYALIFYLLCPNFLAHGMFVSSDIYACFFLTLTMYFLWRLISGGKFPDLLLLSVSCGLAQISKFSMFHIFFIIPLIIIAIRIFHPPGSASISNSKVLYYIISFLFINWLIVSASHFFFGEFTAIKNYHFRSTAFIKLQHLFLKTLPGFPVPLPSSYVNSMDAVMYFDQIGGGAPNSLNGPTYLLGHNSTYGFWYYFVVTLFFKLPIPFMMVLFFTTLLVIKNYKAVSFFTNEVFLFVPAAYYLVYLSFFYSTQVGVRHILMILPLLFILCGRAFNYIIERKKQYALYFLLFAELISVGLYFPHFLPYTNEFIWNKKMAYKKIGDSSLIYEEGKPFVESFLNKHKDVVYLPDSAIAGKFIIPAIDIANIPIATLNKFNWARNLNPVDHIHSQYLVYALKQAEADSLNRLYRR
jgi:hypothetical protein